MLGYSSSSRFGLSFSSPDARPSSEATSQPSTSGRFGEGSSQSAGRGRRDNAPSELPCIPATAGMLHRAAILGNLEAGKCKIYKDVQCGVVSIVGWVVEADVEAREPEFELADGTAACSVGVVVNMMSEHETWLRPKLREILKNGSRVRVIGHPFGEDTPKLRAVHVRAATPADSCYYHLIETVHTFVGTTAGMSSFRRSAADDTQEVKAQVNAENSPPRHPHVFVSSPAEEGAKDVELPQVHDDVKDQCQRLVIRYVLDNRKSEIGVRVQDILRGLSAKFGSKDVNAALECLDRNGNGFESVTDYFDVLS